MRKPAPLVRSIRHNSQRIVLPLAILCALSMLGVQPAQPQTFNVIHGFTGAQDGANPAANLTIDSTGHLYGTTFAGTYLGGRDCAENGGCGIVFEMKHRNASWVLTPLYTFTGFDDGAGSYSPVSFGPGGLLYGTTEYGGDGNCTGGYFLGCGVVTMQPPSTACRNVTCSWTETPIYQFADANDGINPGGNLVFDQAGNIYGTTEFGGDINQACRSGCGIVYKLTPSGSGWMKSTIYAFTGGADGAIPISGLAFDHAGNLYGTAEVGGANNFGVVYKLTPSGSGWTESVIYTFQGAHDGKYPLAGLVMDNAGNFYGAAGAGGMGLGGTVFELSPSGSGWTFSALYSLIGGVNDNGGPGSNLTLDPAGNLFGTTYGDGADLCGNVFKLTFSGGRWNYTDLYDFTCGNDGGYPVGGVTLDASGNLYRTTTYFGPSGANYCGVDFTPTGCGVVWEITP